MNQILLTHWRAPGDTVCMTAAIRDLALSYPGRYEIHIAGTCPEIWENNPYIARCWGYKPPFGMDRYRLAVCESLIQSDHIKLHYITAFHRDLSRHLGVPVPCLNPRGDLHLSDEERSSSLVPGRYWLICAGGKNDMPIKIWPADRFQQVVDRLRDQGIRSVQGGAMLPGMINPKLRGVENYVGKTDLRGFVRLVYHADGVICPISFPMHAAAAFDRPCVVIAGGREPWWWAAYTNTDVRQFGQTAARVAVEHRFLHAIGTLDCCRTSGCWKTHAAGDLVDDTSLCTQPLDGAAGQKAARCVAEITPDEVVAAVLDLQQCHVS